MSDALEIKGKPPKLKFDILEFLVTRGNSSKAGLRDELDRWYPDISHSVDDLARGGYIEIADKKLGRGKAVVYYATTKKGLKALLYYDNFDPIRFWKILHAYCQNTDGTVTLDQIDEFYQIVIRRFLKDHSVHPSFSQLDIFDDICNNWFQDKIAKPNGITPLQKVIEILALNRKITLEKLLEKIDEPEKRLKEILRSHSSTLSFNFKGYTEFFIRNIIIKQSANDAKPTYELSLFGVVLCLVMISYNDMDRLKGGLYCKSSFEKYYDMIALNYREKLPLIFGKWNQLKGILKVFAYYNFDIIFDRKIRSNNRDSPSITKEGNKQLIEGIREIILDNRESMSKFVAEGRKVLQKYINIQFLPKRVELSNFGIIWLCAKFKELSMLLEPTPSTYPTPYIEMMDFNRGTSVFLKNTEKSFADEITAFYYMNLHKNSNIRVSKPRKYHDSLGSSKPLDKTPKQCLSVLLEQDKEKPLISEWFNRWIQHIGDLQKQVCEAFDRLQSTRANHTIG